MAFPGDHKTVQFPRNVNSVIAAYTGPSGQVVMDTTNNDLRLHDGVTVGGLRLANWTAVSAAIAAITILAGSNALALAGVDVVQRSWPGSAFGQFAPKASPALSGTPTAPTPGDAENSTRLATTEFMRNYLLTIAGDNSLALAGVNTSQRTWPATALGQFAPLASPALTGTPTAPTAATGDSSTKLATTAFVANNYVAGPDNRGTAGVVDFPIGHHIIARGSMTSRNSFPASTVRTDAADTAQYQLGGGGAALSGNWRARGAFTISGVDYNLLQRAS